jgi:hypothetical protein
LLDILANVADPRRAEGKLYKLSTVPGGSVATTNVSERHPDPV